MKDKLYQYVDIARQAEQGNNPEARKDPAPAEQVEIGLNIAKNRPAQAPSVFNHRPAMPIPN